MRNHIQDLQGLEITTRELQQLTNLPINNKLFVISQYLKILLIDFIKKVKGPEGATAIFIGLTVFIASYIVFDVFVKIFAAWLFLPSWLSFIIFFGLAGLGCQLVLYFIWKQRNKIIQEEMTFSLENLLRDVSRYNAVVKAIYINDQIQAAGNQEAAIKDRKKVIEALRLTRADLIRALKTEKILRENKNFIISNTELFANNLAALTAIDFTEQATEHGRLLNEALQIALDVQHEMRNLQEQQ
ncbi:MAG: hypothetical protein ACFB02_22330 [Mastigocoleus sp.]